MAVAVYILCAATSLLCAVLLFRGYSASRARLLLWSALCFVGLTVNNLLLLLDKVVLPDAESLGRVEFALLRSIAALIGLSLLLYGLVWDAE